MLAKDNLFAVNWRLIFISKEKKYHCIFTINNRDSCVCYLCFMKHILVQSSQSSFCFRVVRAILHFIIHLPKWPFSEFSELLQKCEQAEQKYILDLAFSLETVVSWYLTSICFNDGFLCMRCRQVCLWKQSLRFCPPAPLPSLLLLMCRVERADLL